VQQALEKGFRSSDIVAFIVTPDSIRRPSFLFELGAAIGMGKRAVPIVAKEVRASDVPFPLRSRMALKKESPEDTAVRLLAEAKPDASSH
jgi:hypothetical protein